MRLPRYRAGARHGRFRSPYSGGLKLVQIPNRKMGRPSAAIYENTVGVADALYGHSRISMPFGLARDSESHARFVDASMVVVGARAMTIPIRTLRLLRSRRRRSRFAAPCS